jgi:hypothetical protein
MKLTLTVACHEADRDDAAHLAVALGWIEGWSPAEWEHAFTVKVYDSDGNEYRVMSCPVVVSFVQQATMMGPIERPPQDVEPYIVNLTGARRAQNKLVTWTPESQDAIPLATPTAVTAVAGLSGRDALAAMGLSTDPPPSPEDDLP